MERGAAAKAEVDAALAACGVPEAEQTPDGIIAFFATQDPQQAALDVPTLQQAVQDVEAMRTVSVEYDAAFARKAELGKDVPGRVTEETARRQCGCGKVWAKKKAAADASGGDPPAPVKVCTPGCSCRSKLETCGPLCFCWGVDGAKCNNHYTRAVLKFNASVEEGGNPPDVVMLEELIAARNYKTLDWCHTVAIKCKKLPADATPKDDKCQLAPDDRSWEKMVCGEAHKDEW